MAGTVNLRARDGDGQWNPLIWNPITNELQIGPPMPFFAAMAIDTDSGIAATSGMLNGESAIWRWIPGQEAEYLALPEDDLAVLTLRVNSQGVVLATVLTFEPVYGQDLRVWLPQETSLIDARGRVLPALPDGDLTIRRMNGHGDAIVESTDGLLVCAALSVGDVDGDGHVGIDDLLELIAAWGPWEGPCGPDLDFDGDVDVDDALLLLSAWS
jgi:hypothetical protein